MDKKSKYIDAGLAWVEVQEVAKEVLGLDRVCTTQSLKLLLKLYPV